jgi:hypothetical protein
MKASACTSIYLVNNRTEIFGRRFKDIKEFFTENQSSAYD